MRNLVLAFLCCASVQTQVQAACPNQVTTVTVPVPGSALVTPVDSTTCMPLDATKVTASMPGGIILGPTSSPAFTTDSAGIHLSAGSAPLGASYTITFSYAAKTWTMTALIGNVVTPVGTTTTP